MSNDIPRNCVPQKIVREKKNHKMLRKYADFFFLDSLCKKITFTHLLKNFSKCNGWNNAKQSKPYKEWGILLQLHTMYLRMQIARARIITCYSQYNWVHPFPRLNSVNSSSSSNCIGNEPLLTAPSHSEVPACICSHDPTPPGNKWNSRPTPTSHGQQHHQDRD